MSEAPQVFPQELVLEFHIKQPVDELLTVHLISSLGSDDHIGYIPKGPDSSGELPKTLLFAWHQTFELRSGACVPLKRHHTVIQLGEHPCQRWWFESLHFFTKVGWHAGEFVKCPTGQASWQDHLGLLVVPPVRIDHPRKMTPPVGPVLVAAGLKPVRTYRPKSEHSLPSVKGVCCRQHSLCHQLTSFAVHRHCNRIV